MNVVNVRYDVFDTYIGRYMPGEFHRTGDTSGRFGNPYLPGAVVPRHYQGWELLHAGEFCLTSNCLQWYEEYLRDRIGSDAEFRDDFFELEDNTLGCWCKGPGGVGGTPCHGDVMVRVMKDVKGR